MLTAQERAKQYRELADAIDNEVISTEVSTRIWSFFQTELRAETHARFILEMAEAQILKDEDHISALKTRLKQSINASCHLDKAYDHSTGGHSTEAVLHCFLS